MTTNKASRAEFEKWYVENAFDLERNPIGCRECGLQWKAWQAALASRNSTIDPIHGDKKEGYVSVGDLEALREEVRTQAGLKDHYADWEETERMFDNLINQVGEKQ